MLKTFNSKLVRSVLFCPADRIKLLEKSLKLKVDVIIFDLEDSVSPDKKRQSRTDLCNFVNNLDFNSNDFPSSIMIRINCPHTSIYGEDDILEISKTPQIETIVVPKVNNINQLQRTLSQIPSSSKKKIWAMIETAEGVLNASSIATESSVSALVLGGNDLTKDLRAKFTEDRKPLHYSMSHCVAAARASGKLVIDAVYMDISNNNGFTADCRLGRDFGFDGKSLIHPGQIEIANNVFGVNQEELNYAKRIIAAWEEAIANNKSVALLDNKLIEYLHVHEANATIEKFKQIEKKKEL